MNTFRSLIVKCLLLTIIFNQIQAAEVLVDSGQRQTVVERTMQYAGNVDALDIRVNANLNFQKNLKVHSGGTTAGLKDKCEGYTVSSCGVPCCGQQECSSVCVANHSVAHGDSCLSEYNKSWCGMSCCGREDCDRVCYNYRTSTVSVENCGGYIQTATGQSCCGLEDCRKKNCNGHTSVISADYGIEQKCCGEKNCNDVKCDYSHSTDVISGGTAKCCGTKDCYSKYCEEMTAVDSKVYPDKKNLECCGKVNCHLIECDGYVQTNTPSGVRQCCGYEDCRDKECQYRRSATNEKGEKVACCGILECGNIEYSRTYEEPAPNGSSTGVFVINYITKHKGCRSCKWKRQNNYFNITIAASGVQSKVKITTGVGTKVPSGCSQTGIETYDNLTYYKYMCKQAINSGNLNELYTLDQNVVQPGLYDLPWFPPCNVTLTRKDCPSCPKLNGRIIGGGWGGHAAETCIN
jgi:hypothetical protein